MGKACRLHDAQILLMEAGFIVKNPQSMQEDIKCSTGVVVPLKEIGQLFNRTYDLTWNDIVQSMVQVRKETANKKKAGSK